MDVYLIKLRVESLFYDGCFVLGLLMNIWLEVPETQECDTIMNARSHRKSSCSFFLSFFLSFFRLFCSVISVTSFSVTSLFHFILSDFYTDGWFTKRIYSKGKLTHKWKFSHDPLTPMSVENRVKFHNQQKSSVMLNMWRRWGLVLKQRKKDIKKARYSSSGMIQACGSPKIPNLKMWFTPILRWKSSL